MATLVLGPLLRYVSTDSATIWVETDGPCVVEIRGTTASTFSAWGHHYALVVLRGLPPATVIPYTVLLDGHQHWPPVGSPFPPSVIRTLGGRGPTRILFGSCRAVRPHGVPFDLLPEDDERGIGVDALRAHGLRMLTAPVEQWPELLVMLGDQVYADDPSPRAAHRAEARHSDDDVPTGLVVDFEEYTTLYRDAWTPDVERWMLSVLPSAMIFDDHDMIDDWNISASWVRDIRAEPWWQDHIVGGLVSYWIYQHLGNLSPDRIDAEGLLSEIVARREADGVLRSWALRSEEFTPVPGGYPFHYERTIGDVHVVVIDSRNGRVLEPSARTMIDREGWRFVEAATGRPCRHLVLATSLPVFVPGGLHALQQWNEAVCAGRWGAAMAWVGERLRRALDMEDWAAFDRSFRAMESLIIDRATQPEAGVATITVLGGDIHFSYATELELRDGVPMASSVHQLVCSPMRNLLRPRDRRSLGVAASVVGRRLFGWLQRSVGREPSRLSWQLDDEPVFANAIGTLEFDGDHARAVIERAALSDDSEPVLVTALTKQLSREDASPRPI